MRVEGLTETKVPLTSVTTSETPVVNDGDPADACSGTSALGALQDATDGNWSGPWEYGQYFVDTIEGESHLYEAGKLSYYWSFWVNDRYEEVGACEAQLEHGDRVLFFPECDEECPAGPTPTPLELEAPTVADTGEAVDLTVKQYDKDAEPSPATGAEISWNGGGATVDAQGAAVATFSTPGTYTLQVTGSKAGPPAIRTETTICVHDGNDGSCGTQAPGSTSTSTSTGTSGTSAGATIAPPPYKGPYALVADVKGPLDGHVYTRSSAPRVLTGTIASHSAISSVSLELRREYRGRCYAYEGLRGRFLRARCGEGSSFKIPSTGSFSYLLPAVLAPGRYVLDVRASDAVGNTTTLARGTSRIVFYVR